MYQIGDIAIYFLPWSLAILGLALAGLACCAFHARRRLWRFPGIIAAALAPMLMAATYTGLPIVTNNTQLGWLPSWQYFAVLRMGVNSVGDATPQWFEPSPSACPISGGDVGSQVPSANGGCFVAILGTHADLREWNQKTSGGITGGTIDATTSLQAAVTAAGLDGVTIDFGPYSYLVTAPITGPTTAGNLYFVRLSGTGGHVAEYFETCPAGVSAIIVNSNITPLMLSDSSDKVTDICFQMATAAGTRTSGAAISISAGSSWVNGASLVQHDTIISAYNGIAVTGESGEGVENAIVRDNDILSPSNHGIDVGASSSGAQTHVSLVNNEISCFSANSAAIGVYFHDAAANYDGTVNGPFECNIGIESNPGAGQTATTWMTGVIGDTVGTNCLVINASASNAVNVYNMVNKFWCTSSTGTAPSVLIENTGGGAVSTITLGHGIIHGQATGTAALIDLEGNVQDVLIDGDQLSADGSGTGNIGIIDNRNSSGVGLQVTNNDFNNHFGTLAIGVEFTGNAAAGGLYTGNKIQATVPWSGQVQTASGPWVIKNNYGIDTALPSLVSGTDPLALPVNPVITISGIGVNTEMTGFRPNFDVTIVGQGSTYATGGATGAFCTSGTFVNQVHYDALWLNGPACWSIR